MSSTWIVIIYIYYCIQYIKRGFLCSSTLEPGHITLRYFQRAIFTIRVPCSIYSPMSFSSSASRSCASPSWPSSAYLDCSIPKAPSATAYIPDEDLIACILNDSQPATHSQRLECHLYTTEQLSLQMVLDKTVLCVFSPLSSLGVVLRRVYTFLKWLWQRKQSDTLVTTGSL